ncbi:hypothetical protein [Burkholderia vietnamiensis]|uniref:hypothetical protein n=1 Tax=Burkholderia vietnamiensis TaxID=60552 RepID=UPI001CF17E50|nr:hypothetical protein [Burkholderia vietnamiensis]MCA8448929.1 hypothetical protein [Burkholderia vietnamiensis]
MMTLTAKSMSSGRLTKPLLWHTTPKEWTISPAPAEPTLRQSALLNGLMQRTGVMAEQRKPKLVEQFASEPGRASRRKERTTRGAFSKSVQKQVGTVKKEAFTMEVVPPVTIRTGAQLEVWTMRQALVMLGKPLDEILPLINRDTAAMVFNFATFGFANRHDVVLHTIPFLDDPVQLLGHECVLANPECLDALLARLAPEVLNAKLSVKVSNRANWEAATDSHHDQEHYLNVIFPKLHAAGADVMDDRFERIRKGYPFGPRLSMGEVALKAYRRRVLVKQLSALADEAAPAPAQPRARARL